MKEHLSQSFQDLFSKIASKEKESNQKKSKSNNQIIKKEHLDEKKIFLITEQINSIKNEIQDLQKSNIETFPFENEIDEKRKEFDEFLRNNVINEKWKEFNSYKSGYRDKIVNNVLMFLIFGTLKSVMLSILALFIIGLLAIGNIVHGNFDMEMAVKMITVCFWFITPTILFIFSLITVTIYQKNKDYSYAENMKEKFKQNSFKEIEVKYDLYSKYKSSCNIFNNFLVKKLYEKFNEEIIETSSIDARNIVDKFEEEVREIKKKYDNYESNIENIKNKEIMLSILEQLLKNKLYEC